MERFEYFILEDVALQTAYELCDFGDRGWELVSVIMTRKQFDCKYYDYIFKRVCGGTK